MTKRYFVAQVDQTTDANSWVVISQEPDGVETLEEALEDMADVGQTNEWTGLAVISHDNETNQVCVEEYGLQEKTLYVVNLHNYEIDSTTDWEFFTGLAKRDHKLFRDKDQPLDEYLDECKRIIMNDLGYSTEWLEFISKEQVSEFLDDQLESHPESADDITAAKESLVML